jgi:hypothetical protein
MEMDLIATNLCVAFGGDNNNLARIKLYDVQYANRFGKLKYHSANIQLKN